MLRDKWVQRFKRLAEEVSTWSKDPQAKVGCVIADSNREILSVGYNGAAAGLNDYEVLRQPNKNDFIIHAEKNAVQRMKYSAGLRYAFITKAPCINCARTLACVVHVVFCPAPTDRSSKWYKEQLVAIAELQQSGVQVFFYAV